MPLWLKIISKELKARIMPRKNLDFCQSEGVAGIRNINFLHHNGSDALYSALIWGKTLVSGFRARY